MPGVTVLKKKEAKSILRLSSFPVCDLSDIFSLEFEIFNNDPYLTMSLRDALIADLNNYDDAPLYQAGTYAQDDDVNYNGIIYISKEDNNIEEPSKTSLKWKLGEKFGTPCFEILWCDYGLGEYLSRMLLLDSLVENVISLTPDGMVIKRGNSDFLPAGSSDRAEYVSAQHKKAKRALNRAYEYIIDNKDTCFASIDIDESCDVENQVDNTGANWEFY